MSSLYCFTDISELTKAPKGALPVQLYDLEVKHQLDNVAWIGSAIRSGVAGLGVRTGIVPFDFLTIALAVCAADTFVERDLSGDGWTRVINLSIPLASPAIWKPVKGKLEQTLSFLSGDQWSLSFRSGGDKPPEPLVSRKGRNLSDLVGLDSVCLFSGGLDSTAGVIDLLASGKKPLLVSHGYTGDRKYQKQVFKLLRHHYPRSDHFSLNADPHRKPKSTEVSMRTRSLTFLAFSVIALDALNRANNSKLSEIVVPENGFISLNVPLTLRRIGSLSTRTTHPFFLSQMEEILAKVGFDVQFKNPFGFHTKGELLIKSRAPSILKKCITNTVSCSHWKRKHKQCGICVPCIVRRAAIHNSDFKEPGTNYLYPRLKSVAEDPKKRDDIRALSAAIARSKDKNRLPIWLNHSGPIPPQTRERYLNVFRRGLGEIEKFLKNEGWK